MGVIPVFKNHDAWEDSKLEGEELHTFYCSFCFHSIDVALFFFSRFCTFAFFAFSFPLRHYSSPYSRLLPYPPHSQRISSGTSAQLPVYSQWYLQVSFTRIRQLYIWLCLDPRACMTCLVLGRSEVSFPFGNGLRFHALLLFHAETSSFIGL